MLLVFVLLKLLMLSVTFHVLFMHMKSKWYVIAASSYIVVTLNLFAILLFTLRYDDNILQKVFSEKYENQLYYKYDPNDTEDDIILQDPDSIQQREQIRELVDQDEILQMDNSAIQEQARKNVDDLLWQQVSVPTKKDDIVITKEDKIALQEEYRKIHNAEIPDEELEKKMDELKKIRDEYNDDPAHLLITDEDIEKIQDQYKEAHNGQSISLYDLQEAMSELKNDRYNKLLFEEEEKLKTKRYMSAQELISANLLKNETKNPYNILPMDMWFKAEAGAKDIFRNKPCMCPAELNLGGGMAYATYAGSAT